MNESTAVRPTVRGLLDARLREPRVRFLEAAAAQLAARPLPETVAGIRTVLAGPTPIRPEDCRRLHILISSLYHHSGASLELTTVLRHEVSSALRTQHPPKE